MKPGAKPYPRQDSRQTKDAMGVTDAERRYGLLAITAERSRLLLLTEPDELRPGPDDTWERLCRVERQHEVGAMWTNAQGGGCPCLSVTPLRCRAITIPQH